MLDPASHKKLWALLLADQAQAKADILDKKRMRKRQRKGATSGNPNRAWNGQLFNGTFKKGEEI